ncbi:MAG TPA: lipoate--protein ligase family protein, partial [bacterium]|nr:lipoate--protein ligase family protein [bacterium]
MKPWRLLNTGYITGAENMALDHALLTARDDGHSPDTLRYMFFRQDTVLVGFHQCVDLEINRGYCENQEIEINRRLTGGGAILMQPVHIGFELICDADHFKTGLNRKALYRIISEPVVNAMRRIGLNASYRPLNDIEINGRKVSGTGGVDGNRSLLFHGSILMDMDFETMVQSLNIPI